MVGTVVAVIIVLVGFRCCGCCIDCLFMPLLLLTLLSLLLFSLLLLLSVSMMLLSLLSSSLFSCLQSGLLLL